MRYYLVEINGVYKVVTDPKDYVVHADSNKDTTLNELAEKMNNK